jgi:oligosaccharide repeat unit polymerase
VFIAITVSGVLVGLSTDLSAWIVGLALLAIISMAVVRFDLLHPFTWYIPFFFLYSASVPILVWLQIKDDIGSLHETIVLEWIALASFVVAVGPAKKRPLLCGNIGIDAKLSAWMIFIISLGVSGLYLWHIWQANLTSKYEIALSTSILARLDPAFSVLAVAYTVLAAGSLENKRVPWGLVVFSIAWNALSFLLSGERDLVFRILWITIFLYHALYRRIPRWCLAVLATSAIVLVPVMEDLKNVLLRDTETTVIVNAMAVRVLNDEFLTASENLQYYLSQATFEPFYMGETLIWDVKRALLPWFMVQEGPDPQRHFNVMFFPEIVAKGGGKGFTLVGEGYMNFGLLGVVLWFASLGWFVRTLYAKASEKKVWFLVYVVSMPLIVYIIRADFSNLFAQFIKHIAFPILVILLGQEVLHRRKVKD